MDVSDDVLGLVLERVDSHVALIRAAAVCRRWRRAVADPAFLRRFRSLHAPAVAGDYHDGPHRYLSESGVVEREREGPVLVPSTSAVDARHFSLDFLPDGAGSWYIVDSRGSLLLLSRRRWRGFELAFPELAVCEPLTRRCKIIPQPADVNNDCFFLGFYLVDGYTNNVGGRISMSNFRIQCMLLCDGNTHTAMFTAASDTDLLWGEKTINHGAPRREISCDLGRAGGSRYFYVLGGTLIVLDGSTGNFSSSVPTPLEDWDFHASSSFVTNGRDGMPRIINIIGETMMVFAKVDGCEWALEKSILLPEATQGLPLPGYFYVLTRGVGFVVLSSKFGESMPFSVDLETMEVAPATANMGLMMYRCELPWPPALNACLD